MATTRGSGWIGGALATSLLAGWAALIAVWYVDDLQQREFERAQHRQVAERLASLRGRIEAAVDARLYLTRGLEAYVAARGDISEPMFARIARRLVAAEEMRVVVQLARGNAISHIHPEAGNEAAYGLRLDRLSRQGDAVRHAVAERQTVLFGPRRLVQGGTAFVSLTPIHTDAGDYWGLATVLMQRDALLRLAGLDALPGTLVYALRCRPAWRQRTLPIAGDADIFAAGAETAAIDFPGNRWELALMPRAGWRADRPMRGVFLVGGLLLAASLGGLTWRLRREPDLLRARVAEATAALRRSEAKFRTISEAIAAPLLISGAADGRLRYANAAARDILGLEDGWQRRRTPELYYDTRDREALLEELERRGELDDYELRVRDADGNPRWVALYVRRVEFDGEPAMLTTALDIAERKQAGELLEARVREATEELRLREEQLRAMFDNSTAAIILVDGEGRYVRFNRAWTRLLGTSGGRLRVASLLDAVFEGDREAVREELRAFAAGERGHVRAERRFIRVDGRLIWGDASMTALHDGRGETTAVVCVVKEITDRKLAEQAREELMRRMQRMQRMEGIGRLAGGVAHDFNNLLTSVMGNAELLRLELGEDHPLVPKVTRILGSAQHGAGLTQQLLSYAGKQPTRREAVDVARLLDEMGGLLGSVTPVDVDIDCEVEPGCPRVWADAARLRQVIVNLVGNAADAYAGAVGIVRVRAGEVRVGAVDLRRFEAYFGEAGGGAFLRFEVADDCGGIPEEIRERIFEPFVSTRFENSGLGLAAVYGIVREHGGGIEVVDESRGTRMRIYLPLA